MLVAVRRDGFEDVTMTVTPVLTTDSFRNERCSNGVKESFACGRNRTRSPIVPELPVVPFPMLRDALSGKAPSSVSRSHVSRSLNKK